MTLPAEHRGLTIREAAEVIGCNERTVRRLVAAGELSAVRLGARTLLVSAESVAQVAGAPKLTGRPRKGAERPARG